MSYDALVIAAPPDDSERQMGGTLALLVDAGQRILLVNLMAGELAEFAEPRAHARQTAEAAANLCRPAHPARTRPPGHRHTRRALAALRDRTP